MTNKEMAKRAKRRPKNFEQLTPEQQWAIDEELGILDWTGREEDE